MRKSFFVCLGVVLVFGTLVLAWGLVKEKRVTTCFDTDGGLNKWVQGSAYGSDLNTTFYNYTDYCRPDGVFLVEFACNTAANRTFMQAWEHNCTGMNTTFCSFGRCV